MSCRHRGGAVTVREYPDGGRLWREVRCANPHCPEPGFQLWGDNKITWGRAACERVLAAANRKRELERAAWARAQAKRQNVKRRDMCRPE